MGDDSILVASVSPRCSSPECSLRWGAWRNARVRLFAAGSLGAALAPSMELLVATRILQGFGGGLLAGLSYSVIRDALPRHLWTRATGLVSAMWGLGTLFGPAVGGIFAQIDFWRGAFGLLTLMSVALGLMALRSLPRQAPRDRNFGRLPVPSLTMLVLAAAAFSIAAVVPTGWPTTIALIAGTALIAAFIAVDRSAGSPVLPHHLPTRQSAHGSTSSWAFSALRRWSRSSYRNSDRTSSACPRSWRPYSG